MNCWTCRGRINVRTTAWHDYDGHPFCSLKCVYTHRGKEKLA